MAQSPEMQSALADFKAANVTEIRSLCGAGLSRSNAISKILERICESKDPAKVVQEADMTEAAGLAHRLGMAADDALHSLIVRREMRKIKAGGNVSDAEAVVELTRRIRVEVPTRPAPLPTATSPIASSSAAAATAAVSPPHASATGAASPSAGTKPCVAKPHQAGPHRKRGEAGSPGGLERSSSLKRTRRSTSNGKPGAKPGKPAAAKQAAEQVQTEMDADKEKELARQVAALTGEINEAMRSGDRMNIARLMRQREQLRAAAKRSRSLPPPATGGAAAEKEGGSEGGETKRSRVST